MRKLRRRTQRAQRLRLSLVGGLFGAFVVFAVVPQTMEAQTRTPAELVASADAALADGDYYKAVEGYRAALDANPNYLRGLLGLAESYYWLDEYDQASIYIASAARLARTDTRVLNLAGRIAIGTGDLSTAENDFNRVAQLEPNNVDASIGRAELALARGQGADAVRGLEDALRLSPENRKALLSLVLVYEQRGDAAAAQRYLDIALSVHRDEPEVQILAAQYYLRAGNLDAAARAARTAQAIDPMNGAALEIRSQLAVLTGAYDEAVSLSEQIIANDRNNVGAWYVRALAQYYLGKVTDALTSIRTALRIGPDNQMVRIWAEWLAMKELTLDDPVRAELAARRASDAKTLAQAYRFDRAINAYRRALQLAPLDLSIRRSYAEMFRSLGYNASYLQELVLLQGDASAATGGAGTVAASSQAGTTESESLARTIEVYTNALSGGVAVRWGIDQFTIDRTRTRVGLYLRNKSMSSTDAYPGVGPAVLDFITRTVSSGDRVNPTDSSLVDGYAGAFEKARSQDVRFFILVDVTALSDMLSIDAGIYVARTGTLATTLHVVRSGPDHAAAAVDALSLELGQVLPVEGSIVRRQGNRAVIDLGTRDGIAVGDTFNIVSRASVSVAPDAVSLRYPAPSVEGTLTLTAVDDLVAVGDVQSSGLVDLVAAGDSVIPPPTETQTASTRTNVDLFPILYERVRRLR